MSSKNKPDSEWKYRVPSFPNSEYGEYSFAGLPCPTKKALDRLGEEGVAEIDEQFKEMIRWKKTLYGEKSKMMGFFLIQKFDNINDDIVSCLGRTDFANKETYAYPERHVKNSENYVIDYTDAISEEVLAVLMVDRYGRKLDEYGMLIE